MPKQKRLAEVRMRWLLASAEFDTQCWESTFFLELIDEQNRQIRALKDQLQTMAENS